MNLLTPLYYNKFSLILAFIFVCLVYKKKTLKFVDNIPKNKQIDNKKLRSHQIYREGNNNDNQNNSYISSFNNKVKRPNSSNVITYTMYTKEKDKVNNESLKSFKTLLFKDNKKNDNKSLQKNSNDFYSFNKNIKSNNHNNYKSKRTKIAHNINDNNRYIKLTSLI